MTEQLDGMMVTVAALSAGADTPAARDGETLGTLAGQLDGLVSSFRVDRAEPSIPVEPALARSGRALADV